MGTIENEWENEEVTWDVTLTHVPTPITSSFSCHSLDSFMTHFLTKHTHIMYDTIAYLYSLYKTHSEDDNFPLCVHTPKTSVNL